MNIFEALRKDHEIQRNLLEKLVDTSGETEERKRLFYTVKHELEIHEDAEEQFFYNPLFKHELTQGEARHGVAEHHEMDEILEQMDETDFSDPSWLSLAKKLQDKVLHHLEDEERTIFQLAGKVISETNKDNLADKYLEHINDKRPVTV